jgi:radical SAM protein with 4Fe4S-binding SPASM domain
MKGSFEKCLSGIKSLSQKGIRFKLKTMLLKQNIHEWQEIKKIASRFEVDFRMDPAITACLDGDKAPLLCRIEPAEAVKADLVEPDRKQLFKDYYEKHKNTPPGNFLFNCGAGLTNFHIGPDGILSPCMMLNKPGVDLKNRNFLDGWNNEIYQLRDIKADANYKCNSCDKRGLCSACPAYFTLETGSPQKRSEYLCKIAKKRFEAISRN